MFCDIYHFLLFMCWYCCLMKMSYSFISMFRCLKPRHPVALWPWNDAWSKNRIGHPFQLRKTLKVVSIFHVHDLLFCLCCYLAFKTNKILETCSYFDFFFFFLAMYTGRDTGQRCQLLHWSRSLLTGKQYKLVLEAQQPDKQCNLFFSNQLFS